MNIGYVRLHGVRILHTGVVNQEALAFAIGKIVDACDRMQCDARPVFNRTVIRLGTLKTDYRSVRRKTTAIRGWYYIEAMDLVMVFDGLTDLVARAVDSRIPARDLLRSVTE